MAAFVLVAFLEVPGGDELFAGAAGNQPVGHADVTIDVAVAGKQEHDVRRSFPAQGGEHGIGHDHVARDLRTRHRLEQGVGKHVAVAFAHFRHLRLEQRLGQRIQRVLRVQLG